MRTFLMYETWCDLFVLFAPKTMYTIFEPALRLSHVLRNVYGDSFDLCSKNCVLHIIA